MDIVVGVAGVVVAGNVVLGALLLSHYRHERRAYWVSANDWDAWVLHQSHSSKR
jgi:hypothetical protein